MGIPFTRKVKESPRNPSPHGHLEWLSTNWAEYFAEEREPPTSSASLIGPQHPGGDHIRGLRTGKDQHQHSWQDDKWSEQKVNDNIDLCSK